MSQKTLHTGITVTVVLGVVGIFFILGVPFDTRVLDPQPQQPAISDQVIVQDVVAGTGPAAQPGDMVYVQYTGKFQNGTVFDTSVGKPAAPGCSVGYCFILGGAQVISGWDQGLVGAQAGTRRLLIVPPSLGYGAQDSGPIPANSTLIFEIEVLKVEAGPSLPTLEGRQVR